MISLQLSILIKSPLTCQHELVSPIISFFLRNGFWTHCLCYGKPQMLSICASSSSLWCVVTSSIDSWGASGKLRLYWSPFLFCACHIPTIALSMSSLHYRLTLGVKMASLQNTFSPEPFVVTYDI